NLVEDPSTRPETIKWALENLTNIAGGKFKGKLDISQIPTGEADPGQPPELGQMAGQPSRPPVTIPMPPETAGGAPALPFVLPGAEAAGQPGMMQMPTPPPPTGAQYLTPMSQGEQLRQGVGSIESILREAGVSEDIIQQAITQKLTGLRPPTPVKPTKPPRQGWKVVEQDGVIMGVQSLEPTGPQFLRDDPAMPEDAQQFLDEAVSSRATSLEEGVKRDARKAALAIDKAVALSGLREKVADRKIGHKLADSARDSDKLVGKMEAILEEIERTGAITGPQTMALLSFHMSMTIGDLKGGRASWPIIEKHLRSRAWPETFITLVKGIRARQGEAGLISIEQAREWVDLARMRRRLDWIQAREGIQARGLDPTQFRIPADILGDVGGIPSPPGTGAQPKTADEYMKLRGQQ
ncbi:hypothetical protein LCGC14_2153180, partial [marine sediment metagenome]